MSIGPLTKRRGRKATAAKPARRRATMNKGARRGGRPRATEPRQTVHLRKSTLGLVTKRDGETWDRAIRRRIECLAILPPVEPKELLEWRERMALSQEDAAEHLNVTRRTWGSYERGTQGIPASVSFACAWLEAKAS